MVRREARWTEKKESAMESSHKRRRVLFALLVIGVVGAQVQRATHVWANATQEWAAVQRVVGDAINPQAFLSPVMDAIGSQAIQDGAILQIPPGQFVTYQEHPAWMMATVQRMIRRFDVGAYGVMTVESVNEQADIFNTNGLDAVQQADLIQRLRAQPFATSYLAPSQPARPSNPPAQSPLHPPVAVSFFQLPTSIVGKSGHSIREGTGCSGPCPPTSRYERGINGAPNDFAYEVTPPLPTKGEVDGIYMVTIYKTTDTARLANLAARDKSTPLFLIDSQAPRLSIAQPVADNEWLRGYQSRVNPQNGWRDCYAVAGVRYNTIVMLAQVDNYNSVTPSGYVTCQTSYKWSTRVLADLYKRAQAYAQHR